MVRGGKTWVGKKSHGKDENRHESGIPTDGMFAERTLVARLFPYPRRTWRSPSRRTEHSSVRHFRQRAPQFSSPVWGIRWLPQYIPQMPPTFQKHASMSREPLVNCFLFRHIIFFFSPTHFMDSLYCPLASSPSLFVRAYRVSKNIPSLAGAYIVRTSVLWSTNSLPEM